MCRKIAKYGLILGLFAVAGFILGALLTMVGYIALWWEFPRTWQPLTGLAGAPQDLLALQSPGGIFLVRTDTSQLFTCYEGRCEPQTVDWSPEAAACDDAARPAVASFFPMILSKDIRVVLSCESGYQSVGNTVFVVYDSHGSAYWSGGMTMIPTDAGVILVGILGGLVGIVAVLAIIGLTGVILTLRKRAGESAPVEAG